MLNDFTQHSSITIGEFLSNNRDGQELPLNTIHKGMIAVYERDSRKITGISIERYNPQTHFIGVEINIQLGASSLTMVIEQSQFLSFVCGHRADNIISSVQVHDFDGMFKKRVTKTCHLSGEHNKNALEAYAKGEYALCHEIVDDFVKQNQTEFDGWKVHDYKANKITTQHRDNFFFIVSKFV